MHVHRTGPCRVTENLALCYYCMQPLCRDHRVLIAGARLKEGKPKGGATCACLDREACQAQCDKISRILSVGQDARGGKSRQAEREQEQQKGKAKGKHASASGAASGGAWPKGGKSAKSKGAKGKGYRGWQSWGSGGK